MQGQEHHLDLDESALLLWLISAVDGEMKS